MLRFSFKLVYSDESYMYDVPSNWTIKYMFHRIRDYLVQDFGITNAFEFIHIDSIPTSYTGAFEEYESVSNDIITDNDMICNYFSGNRINAFYIRELENSDFEMIYGRIVPID